jgi:hypothetical protein
VDREGVGPRKKRRAGVSLARLSRFYGFWVGGLTPQERFRLAAAIPVLEAEDALKTPGAIPDKQLYDVVLTATGDEEQAMTALESRVKYRIAKGQTPDL